MSIRIQRRESSIAAFSINIFLNDCPTIMGNQKTYRRVARRKRDIAALNVFLSFSNNSSAAPSPS